MNLTELQTEVYAITNRPDLADRTLSAIRAATLKLHQADYFYKDLKESPIVFLTEDYLQQLDYRTVFPQWRALSYLRRTTVDGLQSGDFFTVKTPANIVDEYKQNKPNVCYVAGEVLQVRSAVAFQYALLGYYENPNITLAGYKSWIALDHPFAIVYTAAAQIFKSIGKDQEWATWTQQSNEQLQLIRISNIEAEGQ